MSFKGIKKIRPGAKRLDRKINNARIYKLEYIRN
jgi:hypothetical protein